MSKLDLQYDVINDTPASASPVEANFNRIEQHINQELIERGGTVAMAAQLRLVGDPVSDLDAATKQYVDQILPIGIIMMYGGTAIPGVRWAMCNGAELESATNQALFNIIGQNFSPAGTPAGRFHLPNLVDRFGIGAGTVAAIGVAGGTRDAVVPVHSHQIDHVHSNGSSGWDSPDHGHDLSGHQHRVLGSSQGQSNSHWHGGQPDGGNRFLQEGDFNPVMLLADGVNRVISAVGTYYANTDHSHWIDLWSGGGNIASGGATARHTHTTSTPQHVGRSANEGVAATNANLPPYVGVTHIIRIS